MQFSNIKIDSSQFDGNRSYGYLDWGGAIFARGGKLDVSHCYFTKDTADAGGAIHATEMDTIRIHNSVFEGNQLYYSNAGRGGSLYFDGSKYAEIRNSRVSMGSSMFANSVFGAAGIYVSGVKQLLLEQDTLEGFNGSYGVSPFVLNADTVTIRNSIFHDNSTISSSANPSGGALNSSGKLIRLIGVLAYRNKASGKTSSTGGFASITATDSAYITQSTVVNNTAGSIGGVSFTVGTNSYAIAMNSIFWGNSVGASIEYCMNPTIYAGWEPQFVDSAHGDFRLLSTSTAIDAGNLNALGIPATDLDGNPRSVHQGPDLGAYEYRGVRENKLMGFFNRDTLLPPGNYTVGSKFLSVLDGVTLRISAGTTIQFPANTGMKVLGSLLVEGTAKDSVFFVDNGASNWNGITYIDRSFNWTPVGKDSSVLRYAVFSGATESATTHKSGAKASYHHTNFRSMASGTAIGIEPLGSVRADSCLLNAPITQQQNSQLLGSGSIYQVNRANELYLTGRAYLDNWSIHNTKIQAGEFTRIRNSVLDSAYISATSHLELIGSLMVRQPQNIPAISSSGPVHIIQSTIVNSPYYAVSVAYDSLVIRNSILWGNYGNQGMPQFMVSGSITPIVTYSCIQYGWTGTGNVSLDPLFASDSYQLTSSSPCVNQADSAGVLALLLDKDLAGNHRLRGGKLDMGALELQEGSTPPAPLNHIATRPLSRTMPLFIHRYDLLGRLR